MAKDVFMGGLWRSPAVGVKPGPADFHFVTAKQHRRQI
jgi:hypothetical protein